MEKFALLLLRVSPLYVLIAIALGVYGVPGLLVLSPFLVFAAAGAYLASRKCRQCKSPLFAMDGNLRMKAKKNCPNCGAEIGFLQS